MEKGAHSFKRILWMELEVKEVACDAGQIGKRGSPVIKGRNMWVVNYVGIKGDFKNHLLFKLYVGSLGRS